MFPSPSMNTTASYYGIKGNDHTISPLSERRLLDYNTTRRTTRGKVNKQQYSTELCDRPGNRILCEV